MNKFLGLLFVFAFVSFAIASDASSEETDDAADLSKPAVFIQKHLNNESAAVQSDVLEGIRNFQNSNFTGFKNKFDKWPAHIQQLFQ
ncbi:hypothetical protein PRIPAC_91782 [Pristionchus pacificus]|uniref:Uncharacterized protein n=1 Tax=Pristionchus pacificus TaxID=54126 RepID=A0A2A6BQ89_PRIPA|nr:hypothetical protein PRIPAC_91782 [Pristionchus pacificus]|eukprot:PDM67943.1 hypothetical protein PRIPAC_45987 [Pristionchus pacificus]